jgi:D-alanyl-D-alanine carboxypeptidase
MMTAHLTTTPHAMQPSRSGVLRRVAMAVCALISCFGFLVLPAQGRAVRPQAEVDALVAAGAPGAIALVSAGRTVKSATAGVEVLGKPQRPRAADRFQIASVTKPFTAAVVLQLVQERRLGLNDRVGRWLPGLFPGPAAAITIRQLLAHRSGLFDLTSAPAVQAKFGWRPREFAEVAAEYPLLFSPGRDFSYSSTNYIVLGLVVEAVTHHHFAVELRRRILRPLRLRHTSLSNTAPSGRFLHGYIGSADVSAVPRRVKSSTAGGMISSAPDLARFFRALLTGQIVQRRVLALMRSPISPNAVTTGGIGRGYGLGLARYPLRCGSTWGHDGSGVGYRTFVRASPKGHRVAVLAFNTSLLSGPLVGALIPSIADLYCG